MRFLRTMHVAHVALWTVQLDRLRDFYGRWFGAAAGARYVNDAKGFSSFFLRFDGGAALELMQKTSLEPPPGDAARIGYAHVAFAVGSETAVRELTERMRTAGVPVIGEPRWTGDGYFESVIADPDGNPVEITI